MPLWVLAWAGCEQMTGMVECGPEQCAEICAQTQAPAPPPAPTEGPPPPSPFEQGILDSVLGDVRTGIRPAGPEAVGLCRGKKNCDKFLGPEAGKLSKGSYWVRAELMVPPGPPGTWKVTFSSECTSPTGEVRSFEREYDVLHSGPDKPTTVNLRAITVPDEAGAQTCAWKLVTKHPTGDQTYAGSWNSL
jgi:hypothetical protein